MRRFGWVFALVALSPSAFATDKDGCADAAEEAQALRGTHHLRAARAKLVECMHATCPPVVRQFCTQWSAELDAELPSVVVNVRDMRGNEVLGATVDIDGAALAYTDGSAVDLDPGTHRLRVSVLAGESQVLELLVASGQKRRVVTIQFSIALASDGSAEPLVPAPAQPPAKVVSRPPVVVAPPLVSDLRTPLLWTAGGLATALLGTAIALDISSWGEFRKLKESCGVTGVCAAEQVAVVRTQVTVSALCLGFAAVGYALVAWQLLFPPSSKGLLLVSPQPGGLAATFSTKF